MSKRKGLLCHMVPKPLSVRYPPSSPPFATTYVLCPLSPSALQYSHLHTVFTQMLSGCQCVPGLEWWARQTQSYRLVGKTGTAEIMPVNTFLLTWGMRGWVGKISHRIRETPHLQSPSAGFSKSPWSHPIPTADAQELTGSGSHAHCLRCARPLYPHLHRHWASIIHPPTSRVPTKHWVLVIR